MRVVKVSTGDFHVEDSGRVTTKPQALFMFELYLELLSLIYGRAYFGLNIASSFFFDDKSFL